MQDIFLLNINTQSNKTFHKGKSTINSKAEKIITFFLNLLIEILNIDCLIWWNVASQHRRSALPLCDAVLGALTRGRRHSISTRFRRFIFRIETNKLWAFKTKELGLKAHLTNKRTLTSF